MTEQNPVNMLVSYYPKKGQEKVLLDLVKKHWPILNKAGLTTDVEAQIWRATDKRTGDIYFVEKFQWATPESSEIAHQTPEVMAVWEPMGPVMEKMSLAKIEEA
jgi:hypothetical protein